jgi:uncharacterized protein (TIGR03437 family)
MVEGIIQVNLQLPSGILPGPAIPLTLSIGGSPSQTGLTVALGP